MRANGVIPWPELYVLHLLPGNPQVEHYISGMATVKTVVELADAFGKEGSLCVPLVERLELNPSISYLVECLLNIRKICQWVS